MIQEGLTWAILGPMPNEIPKEWWRPSAGVRRPSRAQQCDLETRECRVAVVWRAREHDAEEPTEQGHTSLGRGSCVSSRSCKLWKCPSRLVTPRDLSRGVVNCCRPVAKTLDSLALINAAISLFLPPHLVDTHDNKKEQ